jgi:hypothetical protein
MQANLFGSARQLKEKLRAHLWRGAYKRQTKICHEVSAREFIW